MNFAQICRDPKDVIWKPGYDIYSLQDPLREKRPRSRRERTTLSEARAGATEHPFARLRGHARDPQRERDNRYLQGPIKPG